MTMWSIVMALYANMETIAVLRRHLAAITVKIDMACTSSIRKSTSCTIRRSITQKQLLKIHAMPITSNARIKFAFPSAYAAMGSTTATIGVTKLIAIDIGRQQPPGDP